MSRTLIVADIHEDMEYLGGAADRAHDADRIVCLGDYWDAWVWNRPAFLKTSAFVLEKLYDENWTLLVGNHDIQYLWEIRDTICSGYLKIRNEVIRQMFDKTDKSQFEFLVIEGNYLFSHAGISAPFFPSQKELEGQTEEEFLKKINEVLAVAAQTGTRHKWFMAGASRGGSQPHGGILWADWKELTVPLVNWNQVVGHTYHKSDVRSSLFGPQNTRNFCMDTQRHYGWLEDGKLTFEELEN